MKYIIPCYRKALTIKHCNCHFTCPPELYSATHKSESETNARL